ncbi:MAG TPA: hypothetical protein VFA86_01815 [Gammaproteobacteria bacterium]|nr:hypothetical protein [Gammaproteobacteria bacterium]
MEPATGFAEDQASRMRRERNVALTAYGLYLASAFVPVLALAALVLNYLRRGLAGEPAASHHRWMIRTFWWSLLWSLIALATVAIYVGMALGVAVWIWWLYRQLKGLLTLLDGQPMPV